MLGLTTTSIFLALPCALVADLGHKDYHRRERASRSLAALGELAQPFLEEAAKSPDREVVYRARRLISDHKDRAVLARLDQIGRRIGRWPWIDQRVGIDRHEVTNRYLARATGRGGAPDWENFRHATRLWAEDQLRGGRPVNDLMAELRQMRQAGIEWAMRHQPDPWLDHGP